MAELGDAQTFLTIPQAAERIRLLGPAYAETTDNQVRRWADKSKLPFFKGFDGRRVISEQALLTAFIKLQLAACRR